MYGDLCLDLKTAFEKWHIEIQEEQGRLIDGFYMRNTLYDRWCTGSMHTGHGLRWPMPAFTGSTSSQGATGQTTSFPARWSYGHSSRTEAVPKHRVEHSEHDLDRALATLRKQDRQFRQRIKESRHVSHGSRCRKPSYCWPHTALYVWSCLNSHTFDIKAILPMTSLLLQFVFIALLVILPMALYRSRRSFMSVFYRAMTDMPRPANSTRRCLWSCCSFSIMSIRPDIRTVRHGIVCHRMCRHVLRQEDGQMAPQAARPSEGICRLRRLRTGCM